jgi:hypothetical protein
VGGRKHLCCINEAAGFLIQPGQRQRRRLPFRATAGVRTRTARPRRRRLDSGHPRNAHDLEAAWEWIKLLTLAKRLRLRRATATTVAARWRPLVDLPASSHSGCHLQQPQRTVPRRSRRSSLGWSRCTATCKPSFCRAPRRADVDARRAGRPAAPRRLVRQAQAELAF